MISMQLDQFSLTEIISLTDTSKKRLLMSPKKIVIQYIHMLSSNFLV